MIKRHKNRQFYKLSKFSLLPEIQQVGFGFVYLKYLSVIKIQHARLYFA